MSSAQRRWRLRLAAAGLGLAIVLIGGELLARVILHFLPRPDPGSQQEHLVPTQVWLARDEKHEREKPWSRYRIVCIGDSCTYGLGVPEEASYPKLLERELNKSEEYSRFEVLNLGVAGYTSTLGLQRLREMALAFQPDLVIASFGLNDKWRGERTDREDIEWERSAAMSLRYVASEVLAHSRLYWLLQRLLEPLAGARRTMFGSLRVVYRVPLGEYRQNLVDIAKETRAAGAEIAFLFMAETPAIPKLTEEGIAAYKRGDPKSAIASLEKVAGIGFMYYPRPMHYLSLAYQAAGEKAKAIRARRQSEQFAKIFPYPHTLRLPLDRVEVLDHLDGIDLKPGDTFDIFSRYRQTMTEVAATENVPLVDMGSRDLPAEDFYDYCHLLRPGYEKVARELATVIRERILVRQQRRPNPSGAP